MPLPTRSRWLEVLCHAVEWRQHVEWPVASDPSEMQGAQNEQLTLYGIVDPNDMCMQ